jgi:hypothetical protein
MALIAAILEAAGRDREDSERRAIVLHHASTEESRYRL